jgi:hypothetical protein
MTFAAHRQVRCYAGAFARDGIRFAVIAGIGNDVGKCAKVSAQRLQCFEGRNKLLFVVGRLCHVNI